MRKCPFSVFSLIVFLLGSGLPAETWASQRAQSSTSEPIRLYRCESKSLTQFYSNMMAACNVCMPLSGDLGGGWSVTFSNPHISVTSEYGTNCAYDTKYFAAGEVRSEGEFLAQNAVGGMQICPSGESLTPDGNCVGPEPLPDQSCNDENQEEDTVFNPIKSSSGDKVQREQDYAGSSSDSLQFSRKYSTSHPVRFQGGFGANWMIQIYERRLSFATEANTSVAYATRDLGRITAFDYSGSSWVEYTKSGDSFAPITINGIQYWKYTESSTANAEIYAADGKLLRITKPNGVEYSLSYSDANTAASVAPKAGLLVAIQSSLGETISLTYNAQGTINSMIDADGNSYTYEYADVTGYGDNLLAEITYPDAQSRKYHYGSTQGPMHFYNLDPNAPVDIDLINSSSGSLVRLSAADKDVGKINNLYRWYLHSKTPIPLTSIEENGVPYAEWHYDAQGRAVSSEHNGAENGEVSYDNLNSSDPRSTATNALGHITTYHFTAINGARKVAKIEGVATSSCVASNTSYTYDPNGNRRTSTNSAGVVTETVRDDKGNITQERRGLTWSSGVGSSLVESNDMEQIDTIWHATFTKPTQRTHRAKINGTWQDIKRENWIYDTHARETSYTITDLTNYTVPYATNGRTRTTTTNYTFHDTNETIVATKTVNGPLNPATQADGVDDITVYTYNNKAQLIDVENAYSHVTHYGDYLNRGVPQTITDENGQLTHMTYTVRGWLNTVTRETSQGNAVTNFDYYPNGLLQKTTLPDGSYLAYEYNDARHLTAVTNNLGERIEYTPSPLDGKWTRQDVKDGTGQIVRTQQRVEDELGRIKKLLLASGSTDIENFYDGDNKLTRRENRVGKKANAARIVDTEYAYDVLDRITATIDTMGKITETDHDGGNETSVVTDARSNATTYLRDGFGDVIQQVSPDTGTTRYWYNALGEVKQKIDARNITMTSTYDALGRKTADQYPSDTTLNVTYQYDQTTVQGQASAGIGRLAAALRSNANLYYTYDDRGNLTADIHSISGINYSTRYSYNAASQLQSMTYPSGRIVSYQRDSLGRVAQINVQDGVSATAVPVVSNITYQAFGPISGFTYGNAIVDTRSYDQNGRLTDIIEKYSTTTIQNLGYAYDWAGNIELLTDRRSSTRTQTLSYDDINRLLTAQGAYGSLTYTYDEVGNRLSGTTVKGSTTTVDTTTLATSSNRIATMQRQVGTATPTSKTFVYDAAGNTTTDFDRTPLTYDAAGRLKSAKNGSTTLLALYNAQGQRISKWKSSTPTAAVHFHYDQQGQLIGETSATGVTQRDYIWLDNIPVAIFTGSLGSTVKNYVHSNYLNSPEVVTDATRTSIWRGDYSPYGSVTVGGSFVNNLRFPGQYLDSETSLIYNYFRDYDVVTGKYVESDPIGLRGGVNTYAYVGGNPVSLVDPLGLAGFAGSSSPMGGHKSPGTDGGPPSSAGISGTIGSTTVGVDTHTDGATWGQTTQIGIGASVAVCINLPRDGHDPTAQCDAPGTSPLPDNYSVGLGRHLGLQRNSNGSWCINLGLSYPPMWGGAGWNL